MKQLTLTLTFFLFCGGVFSQQILKRKTVFDTIKGAVTLEDGRFIFSADNEFPEVKEKVGFSKVRLSNGRLEMELLLPPLRREEEYRLSFQAFAPEKGYPVIALPQGLSGDISVPYSKNMNPLQIIWENFLVEHTILPGEAWLYARADVWGALPVACDREPDYNKTPYIWVAVGGAAFVAGGWLLGSSSDRKYQDYQRAVFSAEESHRAEDYYAQASGRHEWAYILGGAGLAALVIDGVAWLWKDRNIRKKKKLYYEYCPNKEGVSFTPVFHLASPGSEYAVLGFYLNYQF